MVGLVLAAHGDCCQQNLYLLPRHGRVRANGNPCPMISDSAFGRGGVGQVPLFFAQHPGMLGSRSNVLMEALFEDVPAFTEMYLRRMRTLMDEVIQPPGTAAEELKLENRIDRYGAAVATRSRSGLGEVGELDQRSGSAVSLHQGP